MVDCKDKNIITTTTPSESSDQPSPETPPPDTETPGGPIETPDTDNGAEDFKDVDITAITEPDDEVVTDIFARIQQKMSGLPTGANAIVIVPKAIKDAVQKQGGDPENAVVGVYTEYSKDATTPGVISSKPDEEGHDLKTLYQSVVDETYIQVVEWGLGYAGSWCQIEIVDSNRYQAIMNTRKKEKENGTLKPIYMLAKHIGIAKTDGQGKVFPPPTQVIETSPEVEQPVEIKIMNVIDIANWDPLTSGGFPLVKRQTAAGYIAPTFDYIIPVKANRHKIHKVDPWELRQLSPDDLQAQEVVDAWPDVMNEVKLPAVTKPLSISPDDWDAPQGIPRLEGVTYYGGGRYPSLATESGNQRTRYYGVFPEGEAGQKTERGVREAALRLGVLKLLRFYNKNYTNIRVLSDLLLGTIGAARPRAYVPGPPHKDWKGSLDIPADVWDVAETWTDSRNKLAPGYLPGDVSRLEPAIFLVCVPKSIFDAAPEYSNSERLRIATRDGQNNTTLRAAHVVRFYPGGKNFKLAKERFLKKMGELANTIHASDTGISPCEAGDMQNIARLVELFFDKLDSYLRLNNVPKGMDNEDRSSKDLVELGFDKKRRLIYVGYAPRKENAQIPPPEKDILSKAANAQYLWIGLDYLAQSEPGLDEIAMNYVMKFHIFHAWRISELNRDENNPTGKEKPWTEWVQYFSPFNPEISPSSTKRCSYQKSHEAQSAAQRAEFIEKPALKREEVEDNRTVVEAHKQKIAENALKRKRPAADPLVEAIKKRKIKIRSGDDIWEQLLGRVDMSQLSGVIIACIMSRLPPEDALLAWCRARLKKFIEKMVSGGDAISGALAPDSTSWFKLVFLPAVEKAVDPDGPSQAKFQKWATDIEILFNSVGELSSQAEDVARKDLQDANTILGMAQETGDPDAICEAEAMVAEANVSLWGAENLERKSRTRARNIRNIRLEVDRFLREMETFVDIDRVCKELYRNLKNTISDGVKGVSELFDNNSMARIGIPDFSLDFANARFADLSLSFSLPSLPDFGGFGGSLGSLGGIGGLSFPVWDPLSPLVIGYFANMKKVMEASLIPTVNALLTQFAKTIEVACALPDGPPENAIENNVGAGVDFVPLDLPARLASDLDVENIDDAYRSILQNLDLAELCALLKGEASYELLEKVRVLMIENNPFLEESLTSTSVIKELYIQLSSGVNLDFCDLIGTYKACVERGTVDADLLEKKLEDLIGLLLDPFPSAQPLCSPGNPGAIPIDSPAMSNLLAKTASTMYQGVDSTFNQEANLYPTLFMEEIVPTQGGATAAGIDPNSSIGKAMDRGSDDPENAFSALRVNPGGSAVSTTFYKGIRNPENFTINTDEPVDTPAYILKLQVSEQILQANKRRALKQKVEQIEIAEQEKDLILERWIQKTEEYKNVLKSSGYEGIIDDIFWWFQAINNWGNEWNRSTWAWKGMVDGYRLIKANVGIRTIDSFWNETEPRNSAFRKPAAVYFVYLVQPKGPNGEPEEPYLAMTKQDKSILRSAIAAEKPGSGGGTGLGVSDYWPEGTGMEGVDNRLSEIPEISVATHWRDIEYIKAVTYIGGWRQNSSFNAAGGRPKVINFPSALWKQATSAWDMPGIDWMGGNEDFTYLPPWPGYEAGMRTVYPSSGIAGKHYTTTAEDLISFDFINSYPQANVEGTVNYGPEPNLEAFPEGVDSPGFQQAFWYNNNAGGFKYNHKGFWFANAFYWDEDSATETIKFEGSNPFSSTSQVEHWRDAYEEFGSWNVEFAHTSGMSMKTGTSKDRLHYGDLAQPHALTTIQSDWQAHQLDVLPSDIGWQTAWNKEFRWLMLWAYKDRIQRFYAKKQQLLDIENNSSVSNIVGELKQVEEEYKLKGEEVQSLYAEYSALTSTSNTIWDPAIYYSLSNTPLGSNNTSNNYAISIPRDGILLKGQHVMPPEIVSLANETMEKTDSNYLFFTSETYDPLLPESIPPPAVLLGAHILNNMPPVLRTTIQGDQEAAQLFGSSIKGPEGLFDHITLRFIKEFAKFVSTSRFFDREALASLLIEPGPGTSGTCADALLGEDPEGSDESRFLNIEKILEDALSDYERNKCAEQTQEELLSAGAYEKALCFGIVKMLLRIFVIEHALRALFTLSAYNMKDAFYDKVVVDYLIKKALEEIDNGPNSFYTEAKKIVKEHFDNLKKRGDVVFIDPLAKNQPVPDQIIDESFKKELLITDRQRMTYLIKLQIKSIGAALEEFIGTTNSNADIIFLESLVPTYNVPEYPHEPRLYGSQNRLDFFKLHGGTYDPRLGVVIFEDEPPTPAVSSIAANINIKNDILTTGGFVLEKYIRADILSSIEIQENINYSTDNGGIITGENAELWSLLDRTFFLSPASILENTTKEKSSWNSTIEALGATNPAHLQGSFLRIFGPEPPLKYIDKNGDEQTVTHEQIFDGGLKWGLRLVYILDPSVANFPLEMMEPIGVDKLTKAIKKGEELIEQSWNTDNVLKSAIYQQTKDKAYKIVEEIPSRILKINDQNIIPWQVKQQLLQGKGSFKIQKEFDDRLENDPPMAQQDLWADFTQEFLPYLEEETVEQRVYYSIPLITLEEKIEGIDEIWPYFGYDLNYDLDKTWDMEQKMIATDEYKMIFDYIFGFKRLIGLVSIYNMVCAHTLHNLDDAFDATKIKLRKLFQTIMNARDPNGPQIPELSLTNAQVAKAFGNSTGTRPGIVAPGLADFAAQVAKQQLLTPVYLVKGLAEAVDPCVKSMVQDEIPEIWGSIGRKVRPVNIFIPPFGSDPPLTPIGMVALSLNYLLPQEKQQLRQQACLDGDQYGSASYKDRYGQAANRAIIKRMDLIYQKSNTQTYEGALASTSITQSEKNILTAYYNGEIGEI